MQRTFSGSHRKGRHLSTAMATATWLGKTLKQGLDVALQIWEAQGDTARHEKYIHSFGWEQLQQERQGDACWCPASTWRWWTARVHLTTPHSRRMTLPMENPSAAFAFTPLCSCSPLSQPISLPHSDFHEVWDFLPNLEKCLLKEKKKRENFMQIELTQVNRLCLNFLKEHFLAGKNHDNTSRLMTTVDAPFKSQRRGWGT